MQNISLILGTVWNEVKKEKKKDNKLKNKENDITFYDGVFTNEDEEDDYCREEYEYKEQEYEKQDKYLIAEIMNGKIKVDNIGMKKDEDMIVELDIEVCGKEIWIEEEKDGNKEQIKHNIKINFDTIGEGGNMGDLQQVPKDTIIEMIENLEKLRKERESNTLEIIAVALEKDRAITLLYGQ
ncbi:MAG: hypothetical protein EZS28_004319 [Streblomastix strix]|uniref:Uncharacterized protein n=1 Tax=Streblomastix strix TaxID=222440 RepID=A0A5J4WYT9_9EUKA|nr:MAG: hypothetical protein EZS28_004319 [Streblomastix strix]